MGVCVGEGLGVGDREGVGEGDGFASGEKVGERVVVDGDPRVGVSGKISEAETIFGWIKLEEISNSEIIAGTAVPKKVFSNLPICYPFISFTRKKRSFQDAFPYSPN